MRLCFALALLALAACEDPTPIAGGPCTYETSIIEATVLAVEEDGALFDSIEGEIFLPAIDLPTRPLIGETFILEVERILTGTCTPEIITVVASG